MKPLVAKEPTAVYCVACGIKLIIDLPEYMRNQIFYDNYVCDECTAEINRMNSDYVGRKKRINDNPKFTNNQIFVFR